MPCMISLSSNTLSRWSTDELLCWLLRGIAAIAGTIVMLIVAFLVVEALPVLITLVCSDSLPTLRGTPLMGFTTLRRCCGGRCSPWLVLY
jgi:hypothetical protein